MNNFSLQHVKTLYNPRDWKEYITKYFYPLADGNHVLIEYNEHGVPVYHIKDTAVIKSVYFNRMSKEMKEFYFNEYDVIRSLTCELNKPRLYDDKFNMCQSFLHLRKPYDDYDQEIKNKVELMKAFYMENWAKGNAKQYDFIMKWLSNMVRGGKNQSLLYLRSAIEGIGKSTGSDFIFKHVIGENLCYKGGSQPLVSQFNSILFGKLFVIYEELENFGLAQWQTISSRIKRDLTSSTSIYESKGVDSWTGKNLNNIIINSNVDAIKDDGGRRIFILDLNTKRKGDLKYWDNLYKTCFNDEVGEAFYNYLHDKIDLSTYHDQDFPETDGKKDALAKRLCSVYLFIKEEYVLKKEPLKTNLKLLYDAYVLFCTKYDKKPCSKIDFNKTLDEVTISSKKSGNENNKFVYSYDYLLNVANKHNWIHSTDDFEDDSNENQDFGFVVESPPEIDYKTQYEELLIKYNELINKPVEISTVQQKEKKTVIKATKTTSKKPVQDYDLVEESDDLMPDSVLYKEQEKLLQSKKKNQVADNCESDCDDETIQETVKELSCLLEF
jgi:hypothetical protein